MTLVIMSLNNWQNFTLTFFSILLDILRANEMCRMSSHDENAEYNGSIITINCIVSILAMQQYSICNKGLNSIGVMQLVKW